jgi:hypothetical protein
LKVERRIVEVYVTHSAFKVTCEFFTLQMPTFQTGQLVEVNFDWESRLQDREVSLIAGSASVQMLTHLA